MNKHTIPNREPDFTHQEAIGWDCKDHTVLMVKDIGNGNEAILASTGMTIPSMYKELRNTIITKDSALHGEN